MVRIINKKSGFTIAEALISMLILSVFIGLSMKIFTKKHTKPVYNASHGTYVCYRDQNDGKVYSKFGAAAPVEQVNDDHCTFHPAKTATYYVLSAVGGGGGGNNTKGGSAGQFETMFLTNIADDLNIYPGAAGQPPYNGSDTVVKNKNNSDEVLLSVKGGLAGTDNPRIKKEYVRSCQVVPLANVLNSSSGDKTYLINSQADDAKCDVGFSSFTARLCPTESNIKDYDQKDLIYNFYNRYAQYAFNAVKNWTNDVSNGVSFPTVVSVDSEGVWMYENSRCTHDGYGDSWWNTQNPCAGKKYVFDPKGDKLYYYPNGKNGSRYIVSSKGNNADATKDCMTSPLSYSEITINAGTDSYSVIRADKDNKFKYIIDLKYDLTKSNTTDKYIGSGFGEYLKNASLKDVTTQVLFKGDTDESMGDGGAKGEPGMPGAVFIAW